MNQRRVKNLTGKSITNETDIYGNHAAILRALRQFRKTGARFTPANAL
jgi:hypothetical protein